MAGTQPRKVLKARAWRTTAVEGGPDAAFVKRFHDARFPGPLVGRWLDRRRARGEARTLADLERAGLPVPRVLGVTEDVAGVELRLGLIDGARPLEQAIDAAPAALARELGALLARLHAAGYAHGDLHLGNVLVQDAGARARVWLVDAAAIRARAGSSARAHDLVRAAAESRERTTARFRARFLLAYLRGSDTLRRAEAPALVEALEGAARVERRARVRAESDRWLRESGACARHADGALSVLAPHELARDDALALARRALAGLGDPIHDGAALRVVRGRRARVAWRELARLAEHRIPAFRPRVLVEAPVALAVFDAPAGARTMHYGAPADGAALGTLAGSLWDRGLALRRLDVEVAADGVARVGPDAGLCDARALSSALSPWVVPVTTAGWSTSPHFRAAFVAAQRGTRVQREHVRASDAWKTGRGE